MKEETDSSWRTCGRSEVCDYGAALVAPTVMRTGYTFKGWSPNVAATVPAEDVTYTAQWAINQYAVTFNANGGDGGTSGTQDYGTAIVAPTVTRTGYTFKGWTPNVAATVPAEDVTYAAQWTPNKYAVTFDANGGSGGATATLDYGAAIVPPTVTRTGYTFLGWSPEVAETVPLDGATYTAQWKINNYTVTFDANGGEGGMSRLVEYGSGLAMPTVLRKDYDLVGWFTAASGGSLVAEGTAVTDDMTLYAHWELKPNTWLYDVVDGKATITSYSSPIGDIVIPSEIDGYPVTEIGTNAFENCAGLTSVTIPDSVTRINANAFDGCSMLTNVVMGGGVKRIEKYAFARCAALESVAIPEGVTYIDKFAFAYDTKLERVDLPDSVTNIGEAAFRQCKALTEVALPANLPRVRQWAFSDCVSLTNVAMNAGVASIESEAFSGCRALASITIPDSVQAIDGKAFYNCSMLTNVVMGAGVKSIGQGAFEYCAALKEIHISDLAAWCGISISTYTACPFGAGYSLYLGDELVTDVAIPDGVEAISYKVFDSCISLTAVTMAESVTNVGWSAFRNCANMTNAVLGVGVKSISKCAFEGCAALRSARLPLGLESIGDYAFYGCAALEGIWFDGDAPAMGEEVFVNASAQACAYVRRLSKGWGVDIPGAWNGIAISYVPVTKVETPVITGESGGEFWSDSYTVTMSCETEGAAIYYTDDGSTPRLQEEYLYAGPISITDTTTFKAVAVLDDMKSEYVTATVTKRVPAFEDVLDSGDSVSYSTDGDVPWLPAFDEAAMVGGKCARSAKIGDRTSTWLSATVSGAGQFSFWCKTSCEHDEDNAFSWDRLMVYTNDVEIVDWRMDGETEWTSRELAFAGGENTVKWVYYKDRTGSAGEDCAWVDEVVWTPTVTANVVVDAAKGTVEQTDGGYVVTAAEGVTLTADDIVFGVVAKEAYTVKIAADGKSATVTLNAPVFGAAVELDEGEAQKDESDPSGALVAVDDDKIAAKPAVKDGETVGALPVKTYPGLYYQASWGGELDGLTAGEKVRADGGSLYLGVIRQTGSKGFYKLTVSEQ